MNDRQDPPSPDDWPGDRHHDPYAPGDPYAGYPAPDPYRPADPYQQGGYQQSQPGGYDYEGYGQPAYPAQGYQQGYPQDPQQGAGGYDPYGTPAPHGGQGAPGQPSPYDPNAYDPHSYAPQQSQAGQGQPGQYAARDEPYQQVQGADGQGPLPGTYPAQQTQGYHAPQDYPGQQGLPQEPYGTTPSTDGLHPSPGPGHPGATDPYASHQPDQAAAPSAPQRDAYGYASAPVQDGPRTATHRRVPRQTGPAQPGPAQPGSALPGQAPAGQGPAQDATATGGAWLPRQAEQRRPTDRGADPDPHAAGGQDREQTPGDGAEPKVPEDGYRTEQFSFIEEPDEESEDVIDWLKFAETRSERRDERKRQLRTRLIGLVAAVALVIACGVGYLWYADKLPGMSGGDSDSASAGGPQQRQVIVVHLRETKGGGSSSALLVDNETTKKGSTVLLPNALAVSGENGTTTLGTAVEEEGAGGTRDALTALLGSEIQGTWRLDTPYLENLVELVGGITIDTDVTVPGPKKGDDPLVRQGEGEQLSGRAAVAYATHQEPGEDQNKQLARFGQVMQAVLEKVSTEPAKATTTVEQLAQIPDPSLSEKQLGASLAGLAQRAKDGSYETELLPVQPDGTLSEAATENVVKDILGGSVKKPDDAGASAPRVSVRNATGDERKASSAQVALVNGGFTVVGGGTAGSEATSRVTYSDAAQAGQAKEVAATLGLPESAVSQGKGAANADVTVVLGRDFQGQQGQDQ